MLNRSRRLRTSAAMRNLVAETDLRPRHLIQPHFVMPQAGSTEISSMPGIVNAGVEETLRQVEKDLKKGLSSVLLFGVPDDASKTPDARYACDHNGVVPVAVKALKKAFGSDLIVMTDVCLCGCTSHGHCGIVDEEGVVRNDESVAILAEMALRHAEAGADVASPSDMMDGRAGAIRAKLDEHGFTQTSILCYAIKHSGAYYGPFREAAHSSPKFGDRKTYQMDPRNAREGLRDALLDIEEGADMLMVKPALPNLDLIWRLRERTLAPICAYHVSSEFSSVKAADRLGWVNGDQLMYEHLIAIRRAGADMIVTYAGREAVEKGWIS
ncbi:delta-aminolevulinic acid dehydratase [Geothrix limicola]|uniref:Delta-aminolevulinic acid dehydratase n=1 Tax=Geothrix limicola TaxID=2927978 RepID=A0ABQ5QEC9_9BACT|nr:porphobilinogen synthase [Geothrix limicola]GLH72500.1 delta-aminolevulinic acid dehydratase [Geothrix limicola]